MKNLVLGNEAIAQGAIDAGISGVYAYPGTPSTEITEYIQRSMLAKELGIFSDWCVNEKTAMEAALGMSYAGKRALTVMKHVGLNVASDVFKNSFQSQPITTRMGIISLSHIGIETNRCTSDIRGCPTGRFFHIQNG